MKNSDIKVMAAAMRRLLRAHGVWVALFVGLLFAAAPGMARAQATCAIDFSVSYNATSYQHVMSMTTNFDEFAACDPRYVANPGDPASGFTPYVQTGATANGGSFTTAVNAADNTISYTAPTGFSGTDTFTVYFCNDAGCSGAAARVASVSVTVGTPTIAVNPASLPAATVASAYSQTLTGSGGQAPYGGFTVISGALPAGLSLSAGGALTGTPTASGSFNFTVRTTDSSSGDGPFQGSRAYTLTVNAPTVTVSPTSLPAATVGSAYSQTVTGAGGTAPYQAFVVTVGALPAGLSLNSSSGALTGTPTAGGSFNFTIRTTDSTTGSGPFNGSRAYSMTVNAPTISVGPTTLPDGDQGSAYSQTIVATGGTAPGSFAVTAGALPAGLTLAAGGALTGTPTVNGSFNFTVTATDSSTGTGPYTGSRSYTLVIDAPPAPVANAVSQTVTYNSTSSPITLDVTGGTATSVATPSLPSNGTVSITGTAITYTPTANYGGPDSFTYTATNAAGTSAPATVTITVSPPTITVSPATLPDGTTGAAYSETVSGAGGSGTYSYAVTAGTPPDGLTLSTAGVLSGTPTGDGTSNFTITATDTSTGAGPYTGAQAYSVTIVTPDPPIANPVSATVAYDSVDNPITLDVTGGAPDSVAVSTSAANGTATALGTSITYTPTTGYFGSDSFAYTATNADGTSAPATVTITVNPQPPSTGAASATVAQDSSDNPITLNISGGTPTSVATPGLPTNGTVSITGTSITYTPTAGYSGADSFTYTATNAGGTSTAATVTVTVNPLPPVANAVSVSVAFESSNNPVTLDITGGTPTSVATPGLPANGSVSITGTSITYTPTTGYAGSDSFTYTAANAGGTSAPATVTVTVNPPAAPIAGAVSVTVAANSSANPVTLDLTGGTATSVATPGLPSNGTVSITGTAITYTPTAGYSGADNFTYTGTNLGGTSAPATVTVTVSAPTLTLSALTTTGQVTAVYSDSVVASLGATPYTYAVTSGALPTGLALSTGGALSGTATAAGVFNFTVTATDANGATGDQAYAITISAPTVAMASPAAGALASVEAYGAYSETFTATGGVGPQTFAVTAGALPPGVSLSSGGALTGAPTTPGTYHFSVTPSDSSTAPGPYSGPAVAYSITVTAPTVVLSPAAGALTARTTALAFSETFSASSGVGPYSYGVTAGAVPTGVSLSSGGVLSGTPTAAGSYNFTVTAEDANGFTTANAYSVDVNDPVVTLTSPGAGALPSVEAYGAYSQTFTATCGAGPRSFALVAGALPPGLSLTSGGVLSGAPTTPGTFNFSLTASDSSSAPGPFTSAPVAYSITVTAPTVVLSPASGALTARSTALAFSETFSASGGVGPYSYTLTAGALPPGVSLSSGGDLSGTPTAAGSYNFTVTAEDSNGFTTANAYSVDVSDPVVTLTAPGAGALPSVEAYGAYSQTFTATGGIGPHSFALAAGALPSGLSLSSGGVLSGAPTSAGTFNFSLTASDSSSAPGPFTSAPVAYSLTVAAPTVTITSPAAGPLPDATATVAYSQTFTATGGSGTHSFAVTAGALPPGLALTNGGVLSGTPTTPGTYNFSVTPSDTSAAPGPYSGPAVAYSITVDVTAPDAPVIISPTDGSVTSDGTPIISGTTDSGTTVQLSINGAAPVAAAVTGGTWSYTPSSDLPAGQNTLTATAEDGAGNASPASATVTFTYTPAVISPATLPSGQVGAAYAAALEVSGGTAPWSFAVTAGALPDGLAMSSAGAVSGTPDASGTFAFTVTATNADGLSASQAYSVIIAAPAPPEAEPETVEITSDSGGGPTTIDLSGSIDNAESIEIVSPPAEGTATVNGFQIVYTAQPGFYGTVSFSYRAIGFADGGPGEASAPAAVTITIAAPTLVLAGSNQPSGQVGATYAQTLTASGGTAPYTYAVTDGTLPTGIILAADGTLAGTPTEGGAFSFTVTATDSSTGEGPFSVSAAYDLSIDAPALVVTPTVLPDAATGQAYSEAFSTSDGVAPYTYAVTGGALPSGLTLSPSGVLSGDPTQGGDFTFTVTATDSSTGAGPYTGAVDVTLTVVAAELTVTPTTLPEVIAGVAYSQQMQASGGQGGYTFAVTAGALPQGLTLSSAGLLSGKPTTAGVFAFTVTATDGFGNTGAAALSVSVIGRPDPSADPDVRGLSTAQAEAARRMVGSQISNFGRRLEQLHRSGGQDNLSMGLTLDASAFTPLDERHQPMGELSHLLGEDGEDHRDVSGLDELRQMAWLGRTDPTAVDDVSGPRLNAGQQAGSADSATSGPRVWAGGAISLGERDATTQTAEMSITTSGISVGVDMSVADNLDVGVGVGFGQENVDVGLDNSRMEAESRMAVAYGSWRPSDDLFIDGILGYGELDFDMRRRTPVDSSMVFGRRDGTAVFGSLSAGLDRIVGPARWMTYGRIDVLNADLDAYVETGSPLWALSYEARSVESRQGALGLRYERDILRGETRWTPGVRLEWTHEFGDGGAQTLRYADWLDGPGYAIGPEGWDRSRLNLGLSLGWYSGNGWSLTGEYDGGFSDGEIMNGLRIEASKAF